MPPAKYDPAPDGGPQSHIQMTQIRTPLIAVVLVSNPDHRMMIAEKDFDPAIHKRTNAPAKGKRARVRPEFSDEPREELLTWQRKRLQAMPEVAFIEAPSSNKEALVDQILAVREDNKE